MYTLADIDVTRTIRDLEIPSDAQGAGIIVRLGRRPIGFFMKALLPNSVVPSEAVHELIREHVRVEDAGRAAPLTGTPRGPGRNSVTVAICTRDNHDDLSRCLDSLRSHLPSGCDSEVRILVVDNAPSDSRTRDLVASLQTVAYVVEPRPGLNFARNRALREATSEIIAFVDDDVIVDEAWIGGLKTALDNHPDAGAVTGLVLPAELDTEAQVLFEANGGFEKSFETIRFGSTMPGQPFYPCLANRFGTGCNMAFRRELLIELGGFDVALDAGAELPGGGDSDMLYRVIRAGHPIVYEPAFLVFHRHRREYRQLRSQLRHSWGKGFMAFVGKTYRRDPAQRPTLRRVVCWWFAYYLRQLGISLIGRHVLPYDILAGQLWGGLVGLLFAYPKSVRRTAQIQERYS